MKKSEKITKNKLSVLVVVNNEEKQLDKCLETVVFADEVIVVLDKCTDKSEIISKKYTKKIYSGEWDIEGERRNFGISKCSYKWILEIDADERVPILLQKEIYRTILMNESDYFLIPVDNYVGTSLIKYGWGAYFGKSAFPGLFKKESKKWGNERVHPKLYFQGKKGNILKNSIKHYYCKNISDMFIKLDSYSSARSLDLMEKKINESTFKNFRRIFSRFWKSYILRKGFKEKKIGFLIAIIAGLYPLISHIKLQFSKKK